MKDATILKTAGTPVTAEQLEKINAFSRRELGADEVYVFSLILCDNEVDRDDERFPRKSLEALARLFIGKTGIFDHNPKGENQSSRIFDTRVEADEGRIVAGGEGYHALRAWAYMMRCDKNNDLILEIDAGIKKEVSVGCAVEKTVCSVCGADVHRAPCAHEKGRDYNGVRCWQELLNPTDAYEWSFVAIPAQRGAGVTKGRMLFESEPVRKLLESGGQVVLTKGQAEALSHQLRELDALAQGGRKRLEGMRRELVRLASFALPRIEGALVEEVAKAMEEEQLEAFCKGLSGSAPGVCQLGGAKEQDPDNRAFLV